MNYFKEIDLAHIQSCVLSWRHQPSDGPVTCL